MKCPDESIHYELSCCALILLSRSFISHGLGNHLKMLTEPAAHSRQLSWGAGGGAIA